MIMNVLKLVHLFIGHTSLRSEEIEIGGGKLYLHQCACGATWWRKSPLAQKFLIEDLKRGSGLLELIPMKEVLDDRLVIERKFKLPPVSVARGELELAAEQLGTETGDDIPEGPFREWYQKTLVAWFRRVSGNPLNLCTCNPSSCGTDWRGMCVACGRARIR